MMQQLAGAVGLVLAEAGPDNAPANNPEWGKAAPTGLFVLLVFVVVCFFLFRSMNRHIKKVPTAFGGDAPPLEREDQLGEVKMPVPVASPTDVHDQTKPRLGTPEEMLAQQKAKRQDKIRKAKERTRRDDSG